MSVLVIEDDRVAAEMFSRTTRCYSFLLNIDIAVSKRQVQTQLFQTKFDLIICDLHLGDVYGPDLLREMQQMIRGSKIYLMTSTYGADEICGELKNEGSDMVGWQHKPLRSSDVHEIIGKIHE